jgi:glycerol-3-phosphate acyltransferase PlsY
LITFAGIVVFLLRTQYGSLASLLFVTVLTVEQGVIYGGDPANVAIIIMLFAIWALVWFCHRTNIVRAVLGKEHRSNLMNSFKKIKTTKDGENEKN